MCGTADIEWSNLCSAGTPATCAGWFSSAPAKPAPPAKDTLYYFPVPGAPGEVARVVLLLGGRDYDDKRIGAKTTPPWSELKPTARFGQMPVFKVGGWVGGWVGRVQSVDRPAKPAHHGVCPPAHPFHPRPRTHAPTRARAILDC